MKFETTPFTQNRRGMLANADILFPSATNYRVGPAAEYDERQTVSVDAADPEEALALTYLRFQNVEDDHQTPDGGASIMKLDLIRLDDGRNVTWWTCCTFGWHQVEEPSDTEFVMAPEDA